MSKNSLSFLTSYFLIITAISALPPPSADFSLSGRTPDAPDCSPITTIVFILTSLHLKEEGDLHREERGVRMLKLKSEEGGGSAAIAGIMRK